MRLFWGFASMEFRVAAMYRLEFWLRILGNLAGVTGYNPHHCSMARKSWPAGSGYQEWSTRI